MQKGILLTMQIRFQEQATIQACKTAAIKNNMRFSYNIKKIDFYPDQFEDKGEIDIDGAIKVFQEFPFKEQLLEANEREMTSTFPTITFINNNLKSLSIWAETNDCFFIHYVNDRKLSDFSISYEFDKNPSGIYVEDIIKLFFLDTIETRINLKKIPLESNNSFDYEQTVTFTFKKKLIILPYLWNIPTLAFCIYILNFESSISLGWQFHLFFNFLWVVPTILHLLYLINDFNGYVAIDIKSKKLTYKRKGKEKIIKRDDISKCEINWPYAWNGPLSEYSYLLLVLKDKSEIVITNFIAEPIEIVSLLNIHYKTRKRLYPIFTIKN